MKESINVDPSPVTVLLHMVWVLCIIFLIGASTDRVIAALDDVQTACESEDDSPLTP